MAENKKFQDATARDWVFGIGVLILFVSIIGISAFLLIPDNWVWWLLIVIGGTLLFVLNQNKNYGCRCRECGTEFEVSFLTNLLSPHGVDREGSWMLVKCPSCTKRAKATVVKVVEDK